MNLHVRLFWILTPLAHGLVMFDTEEVQYIETQVKGVIGHSVVLECGESLPSIYIWGFSRTGFIDIRAVLYNYGQGAKLQKMASIFGDVRVVSDSAALVISNLQLAAEGRFTCQSLYETDDGTKLVYTFVNVFVLIPVSKPFIELSNSSPVEGSVAFVLCTVENGTQPLEYTWTRQSTLSKKFVNVSEATGGLVNLTSVHRNHTGWYTCSVRSEVNEESSDPLWLEVIFGPDEPFINVTPYTLNSMGYSAIEWDTIFLTCSASSNPPSHYIWFYNNSQIYSGQRFVIKKISRSQAGAYMCLAQNSALNARTKTTIILTVYSDPPFNAFPAVIGAAVAGMLLAAVTTLLIFQYVVRNRDNNPWLHNLLFRLRPPSESREEINFPEDAEIAEIPLPAERNENIGTVPPQFTQESGNSSSLRLLIIIILAFDIALFTLGGCPKALHRIDSKVN
uniref:Ig-like domain-containing protein n=1 Tax=Callorhinchus milii TaxID=7868 RepID=A0A4W3GYL1_CALMI